MSNEQGVIFVVVYIIILALALAIGPRVTFHYYDRKARRKQSGRNDVGDR